MANKIRLDRALLKRGLVYSRSQAENYIKLGFVTVNSSPVTKASYMVKDEDKVNISQKIQYVSRAGLKLASVAEDFGLYFKNKIVLDVGSSTGGFTDFALKNGAKKVIAVDVGTKQLHETLRGDPRIELHEQTDIRDIKKLSSLPDIVVIDVSFISIKDVLPAVAKLSGKKTIIVAMVKPQFESQSSATKNKGVIKNESLRRQILKDFEIWAKDNFFIEKKKDSSVSGEKGNTERFYLLKKG